MLKTIALVVAGMGLFSIAGYMLTQTILRHHETITSEAVLTKLNRNDNSKFISDAEKLELLQLEKAEAEYQRSKAKPFDPSKPFEKVEDPFAEFVVKEQPSKLESDLKDAGKLLLGILIIAVVYGIPLAVGCYATYLVLKILRKHADKE